MILVFDARRTIFTRLLQLGLGVPLWHVSDPARLENVERVRLAVVAAYERVPWDLLPSQEGFDLVVVTQRYATAEAAAAIERGLAGYLDADMEPASLRRAILGVLAGEPAYARSTIGGWLRRQRSCAEAHRSVAALTERQRQVVGMVAQGLADKEIAEQLGIATATAQKHVTNILERLRVTNRAAAAASTCPLLIGRELHARRPEPRAAPAPQALYPLSLRARIA